MGGGVQALVVSHGADEGHAEDAAHAEVHDGGGHQARLSTLEDSQGHCLVEEALGSRRVTEMSCWRELRLSPTLDSKSFASSYLRGYGRWDA